MTYLHIISCDQCGAHTKTFRSRADASSTAESVGWLFVRHLGKHFCPDCRPVLDAKHAPPRPKVSPYFETIRARRLEREQTAKRMRDEGATFKEIGAALGVSTTRASQILNRAENAANYKSAPQYIADLPIEDRLNVPCDELQLTVRSANALHRMRIETIGQLVATTPSQLLEQRNFDQKSLNEILRALADIGLQLGSPPKS